MTEDTKKKKEYTFFQAKIKPGVYRGFMLMNLCNTILQVKGVDWAIIEDPITPKLKYNVDENDYTKVRICHTIKDEQSLNKIKLAISMIKYISSCEDYVNGEKLKA